LRISLQVPVSELQNNLEELGKLGKRPVGPIVFVNTCIVFDIVFVVGIEVKVIFWLTTSRRVDGEAIAHRLSSEEVNVV